MPSVLWFGVTVGSAVIKLNLTARQQAPNVFPR